MALSSVDPNNPAGNDKTFGSRHGDAGAFAPVPRNPEETSLETQGLVGMLTNEEESPKPAIDWLQIANAADNAAETYFTTELMPRWISNIRQFNSLHPAGSKYDGDDFKHRSKLVRPKTRSAVRRGEAACAEAFFSSRDAVYVTAHDDDDPIQLASAKLCNELLNYHLSNTIPWYLVLMAGYQTSQVMGVVISKQYWLYREEMRPVTVRATDEFGRPAFTADGQELYREIETPKTAKDCPVVELLPPENIRISQAADWLNPIQSTPYLFNYIPLHVVDVKERMRVNDPKTGRPPWKEYGDAEILGARTLHSRQSDMVRRARERGTTTDPKQPQTAAQEFDIVWVRECIIRKDGRDWHFYTLGQNHLLTDPVEIEYVYPGLDGMRPFTMGYTNIEAFRPYPASQVELVKGLQQAANDLQNSRFDNLQLSINGRIKVAAGQNVDVEAMRRVVPGGIVMMNKLDAAEWDRAPDVTGKAYEEQRYLDNDFDDLAGAFSQGSVSNNRQLGETVGGLNLISNTANQLTRYDLRTFSETWVEPTLRQVLLLIQRFETDDRRFRLAGRRAQLREFGESETAVLMNQENTLRIGVGVGTVDPERQVNAFTKAIDILGRAYGPEFFAKHSNPGEVMAEIFGKLGYKEGKRFAKNPDEDPRIADLMEKIKEMGEEIESLKKGHDAKIEAAQIQADGRVRERKVQAIGDVVTAAVSATKETIEGEGEAAQQFFRAAPGEGPARRPAPLPMMPPQMPMPPQGVPGMFPSARPPVMPGAR